MTLAYPIVTEKAMVILENVNQLSFIVAKEAKKAENSSTYKIRQDILSNSTLCSSNSQNMIAPAIKASAGKDLRMEFAVLDEPKKKFRT